MKIKETISKYLNFTIIERYILNEVKMPIIFGVSLFTFIFLIEIIVSLMESIIVKGISVFNVMRMLSFYLPPIMCNTIPMGVFLGIMLTFSKFTRTSESTAMSSIGMSLKDILKPIFVLAIGLMCFMVFLQESIIPRSFKKLQELTIRIAYENPVFQLKEKVMIDEVGKYGLYIDRIDKKNNEANNVLIFQKDNKKGFPAILFGSKAYWKNTNMILGNSKFYTFDQEGKLGITGSFDEKSIPLSSYFQGIKIEIKDIEAMGIGQLLSKMKEAKSDKKISKEEREQTIRACKVEINRKISIPLATLCLAILGVLLSIGHHRSGKGAHFGVGLGIIFIYIIVLNIGVMMANKNTLPIFVGVWIPNLILFFITYRLYIKKAGEA